MMKSLGDEREGLKRVVGGLKEVVVREEERVRSEAGGEDVAGLVAEVGRLRKQKGGLEGELEGYREGDPGEVERRRELVGKVKMGVNQVTGEDVTLGLMGLAAKMGLVRRSCSGVVTNGDFSR